MIHEFTPINLKGEDAFQHVFQSFYPSLLMFSRRYIPQDDVADDLVQEAFIKLWECRTDFASVQQVQSFLYACVKNQALNEIKHQKVVNRHEQFVESEPTEFSDFDFIVEAETYRILFEAVDELPPRMRDVVYGYLKGMSPDTIAQELNISVETVYSQKQLAHAKLRIQLSKHLSLLLFVSNLLS